MKKLSKVLLPAIIVLMGAGAAFATNVAKNSNATEPGYYFNRSTGQCIEKGTCSTNPGNTCVWEDAGTSHILRHSTSCTYELSKSN